MAHDSDTPLIEGHQNLEFFGRVSASISHELNNVVSIIDQVAGLLEDSLYAQQQGQPINPEQLARIHQKITHQTQRGVKIIKRLNKFSHTVDYPECKFDLKDLTRNFIEICERFADLQRVSLKTELVEGKVEINGSPFLIQQLLFYLIHSSISNSDKRDPIAIALSVEQNKAVLQITVSVEDSTKLETEWMSKASDLADSLGISIHTDTNQARTLMVSAGFTKLNSEGS